jgi:hypothetical protein
VYTERCGQDQLALRRGELALAVVDYLRSHQPDPAVAMFAVVPWEEPLAENARIFDRPKPLRECGTILQRLELRLRVGIVIRNVRTAVVLRDTQVGRVLVQIGMAIELTLE